MNTDKILDFIVEYYVWFVLGGFIIIMAIIGFVADRKKLLPSNSKNVKVKKHKKDEFDFDDEIPNEEEQLDTKDVQNASDNESVQEEKITDLKDSWNIEPNTDVSSNKDNEESLEENPSVEQTDINSNEESTDYASEDYTQKEIDDFENYTNELDNEGYDSYSNQEDENYKENDEYDNQTDENYTKNDEYDNHDDINHDYENITKEQYDDSYSEEKEEIRQDINKIDDMFPDKTDDISMETNRVDHKNNGDNPEQTLQVNYSQLREMVEDIIAETQNESSQKNTSENELETDNHTVQDMPLPNLDHISVDAIKAQDEDEDDVWKF